MSVASLKFSGVHCAVATPIREDLSPDLDPFKAHCRSLIDGGCDGLALLGTTGEANSFSRDERRQILEAALDAGVEPERLTPGTGVAAIPDTVALTRDALDLGITRVLMLPPFYYKGVSDDGLFAAYSEIIERIGDSRLQVVLYHIPQMSGVPLSIPLVQRLRDAYPEQVIGLKDSSGDLDNMKGLTAALPGFSVMSGADPLMLPLLKSGGGGCITAVANLIPGELRKVFDLHANAERTDDVEEAQKRIGAWREVVTSFPPIPAVKAVIAERANNPVWYNVRPPLRPLDEAQRRALQEAVGRL